MDRENDIDQVLHTRLQGVSESLHRLADQFDQDNTSLKNSYLKAMSTELQRIAWNSLFVSTMIETLMSVPSTNDIIPNGDDHTTILRQIDAMHVAVKYLAQSIQAIQAGQEGQCDHNRVIDEALKQLAEKLAEATNECKHSR